MISSPPLPPLPPPKPRFAVGPAGMTAALILSVFAARLVYLVWLCPYELVGDEAYYWEWSRHLDLCYYEKGPGLAYPIAAATRLFGSTEWAVRLPVALASAFAAWVVSRLAVTVSGGDRRAGLFAAACFCLLPAFQANAQLCTQDGVLILCWAAASAAGLRLVRRWRAGELRPQHWIAPAALIGVGFLFKQSMLLLLPSLPVYAWFERRRLRWDRRVGWGLAVAAVVFTVFASPVFIWNALHDWPTLAHTLGHLGAGGDQSAVGPGPRWTPLWFLSLLGGQVGAFGPAFIVLAAFACRRTAQPGNDARQSARLWLICCALPSIAFYFALSLIKPVIASWPFPSFVTLVPLVAELVVGRPDPAVSLSPATRVDIKHRALVAGAWNVLLVYGVAGALAISFPQVLARLPGLHRVIERSFLARATGHRRDAAELWRLVEAARKEGDPPPLVITPYYMTAALDAFYLPGHPTVYNAGTPLGARMTAYDFWPDTDLSDPALAGRNAVLHGKPNQQWAKALRFDRIDQLPGAACCRGKHYRGVKGSRRAGARMRRRH